MDSHLPPLSLKPVGGQINYLSLLTLIRGMYDRV